MNLNVTFAANGSLSIRNMHNLKLQDIEDFCAEARKLGLGDNAVLITSRQGLVGPVIGWHFDIPVVPASKKETPND